MTYGHHNANSFFLLSSSIMSNIVASLFFFFSAVSVLYLDLFSLYSEIIMRNLDGYLRINTGAQCNNLKCNDDPVLIAENQQRNTK